MDIYTPHGGSRPFYDAPIFTVIVLPLALIPFPWTAGHWALLNLSALFAALVALSRWLFPERRMIVAFLSLFLCIDVVLANLENGQINLLLLAGIVFSLRWLKGAHAGRRWLGSGLFAISAVIKVYLLAVSVLLVRRGEMRRGLLVMCAVGLVLLFPFAIFGIDRAAGYYHDWFVILRDTRHHVDLARHSNQSLYAMLLRSEVSTVWPGWAYQAASVTLLGGVVFLVNRRPSMIFDEALAVDYDLVSCAILLTCPLSWVQSYVFILPVVVLMTGGLLRRGPSRGLRVVGFAFTLLAALPARALVGDRLRNDLPNRSIYVWIPFGLFGVLVALRARSSRSFQESERRTWRS